MLVCGFALLTGKGLAGIAVYIVGHGLTKAALFMCAGVLLHRFETVDEYDLHGRGREVPIVGVLMVVGALLLAAIPPFTTFMGKSLLEAGSSAVGGYGWLIAVYVFVSALPGARCCGSRGACSWAGARAEGPHPEQARAAEERVSEDIGGRDHTPRAHGGRARRCSSSRRSCWG